MRTILLRTIGCYGLQDSVNCQVQYTAVVSETHFMVHIWSNLHRYITLGLQISSAEKEKVLQQLKIFAVLVSA